MREISHDDFLEQIRDADIVNAETFAILPKMLYAKLYKVVKCNGNSCVASLVLGFYGGRGSIFYVIESEDTREKIFHTLDVLKARFLSEKRFIKYSARISQSFDGLKNAIKNFLASMNRTVIKKVIE